MSIIGGSTVYDNGVIVQCTSNTVLNLENVSYLQSLHTYENLRILFTSGLPALEGTKTYGTF